MLAAFIFTYPQDRVFVLDLGEAKTLPEMNALMCTVCVTGGVPAKEFKGYFSTCRPPN